MIKIVNRSIILACLGILFFAKDSLALSCSPYSQENYDIIFHGKATKTSKVGEYYQTTFQVLTPLKGNLTRSQNIYHKSPLLPKKELWISAKCQGSLDKCAIEMGECEAPFEIPEFGRSTLHYMACHENSEKLSKVINSSNVLTRYPSKSYGYEASYDYLYSKERLEEVNLDSNQTLLTAAIICKNGDNVKYLLDNYPDLINHSADISPVMIAIENMNIQNKEALTKIFESVDLTKVEKTPKHDLNLGFQVSEYRGTICEEINEKEASALQFAIACASKEVADLALKKAKISDIKKKYPNGLLNFVLRSKNSEVVLSNFDKLNSQINQPNEYGHTPLLNAIIASQNVEIINFLIKSGADVNLVSKVKPRGICNQYMFYGCTFSGVTNPVHMAVQVCDASALEALIASGANLNLNLYPSCRDSLLNTALIRTKETCANVADILFKNNLKICREDFTGGVLAYAITSGKIENLKTVFKNVKGILKGDLEGALRIAVYNGSADTVKYLLDMGVDPNYNSNSPLISISNHRNSVLGVYGDDVLKHTQTTIELLKHGANVNAQDSYGNTALHTATKEVDISRLKVLLEYGAKKDIKNKDGKTAIDMIDESSRKSPNKTEHDKAQMRELLMKNVQPSVSI
jgi:ankyrin repeat protein